MRIQQVLRTGLAGLAVVGVMGCATLGSRPVLRVGVTPDYPPIIAKQEGVVTGLEADFAVRLADALGRRLELVELPWNGLVPALLAGRIDIVMSGMSVTEARQVRIAFSDPYMRSGLAALVRRKDARKFSSRDAILKTSARVGVQKDTTADIFAQEQCPRAQIVQYAVPNDAALALKQRRLAVFIADAPAVQWLASRYEADLVALPFRLTEEALAWGVNPDSVALRQRVNEVLAGWKADGTLEAILRRWLPGE